MDLDIPPGWLDYARKVFRACSENGLKLTIEIICERNGYLVVKAQESFTKEDSTAAYAQTSERIMNALLHGTHRLCPFCGTWTNKKENHFSICAGCLGKYGLLPESEQD